ncbi:hypothetical protein FSP39_017603 [Pinctada imbricata]|uniref:Uncharacterized protein n=1 Tax=Pinctada imbricata TaxID=66713 RepID=A0AA88YVL3_PINIB|nr:hypothetical protein FSP39_017603 [Pinctada imbricata]
MNILDDHAECYKHRVCNADFPCNTCRQWSEEKRNIIEKMVDKAKAKRVPTATLTSETDSVPSEGNPTSLPQASSVGSPASHPAPFAGIQYVQNVPPPPFALAPVSSDWQRQQEELINRLLDARFGKQMDSNNNAPSTSEKQRYRRFDRFASSLDQDELQSESLDEGDNLVRSDDILDIDSRSQISDSRSHISDTRSHLSDTSLDQESVAATSVKGHSDFQKFMMKVANTLHIEAENITSDATEYKSYVSNRLVSQSDKVSRSGLPIDGAILNALSEVDQEFQKKGSIKTYRTSDDDKYLVTREHFEKFCSTPKLDENIEEGTVNVGRKSSRKSVYTFKNSQLKSRNNEFWKIDQAARLMLRELSYSSLIVSYLDSVQSQEEKTEGLRALMSVMMSMADVSARIIVGSVAARRSIHIDDLSFKNKATENKLLLQPTLGNKLFCNNYFDILHSSAENLRDAKETQHLIRQPFTKDKSSNESSNKRKHESSYSKDQSSYKRRKSSKTFRDSQSGRSKFEKFSSSRDKGSGNQNQSGFRPNNSK